MTQSDLKILIVNSILVDKDGVFHIDFSSGWNVSISKVAADYFPDNKFSFRLLEGKTLDDLKTSISRSTIPEITFSVIGKDIPFDSSSLDVTFSLVLGEASMAIKATTKDLNISNHLPLFKDTLAEKIAFNSIQFELDSSRKITDDSSALQLTTNVNVNDTIPGIHTLLLDDSKESIELSGNVWLENGNSLFRGISLFADLHVERTLGPLTISLTHFGIADEILYSFIEDSYFSSPFLTIDASVSIKVNSVDYPIPLAVEIHNFALDSHFKADLSKLPLPGIADLENFLKLDLNSFSSSVPDSLKIDKPFTFQELGFYYNPSANNVTRIYGSVSFDAEFIITKDFPKVGEDLKIVVTGFNFELVNPLKSDQSLEVGINGEIAVGETAIEVQLKGGKDNFSIKGWLKGSNDLALSELLRKFANNKISLPDLSIHRLAFNWSYLSKKTSWSFDIELKGYLPIPFNNPALSLSQVDFAIAKDGADDFEFYLGGVFSVGSVDIRVSAKHDNGWIFEGSTGLNQIIPLGEYIEILWDYLMPGPEHKIPDALSHLIAENIDLEIDTTDGFSFSADVEISESQMVGEDNEISPRDINSPELLSSGDHGFKFEEITLHLERAETIAFTATAKFEVHLENKVDETNPTILSFDVDAEYNDGWEFEADMQGSITLEELIQEFAPSTTIPSRLNDFAFSELKISFNTKSSDKHFSGTGKFNLTGEPNGPKANLILKIDITHPPKAATNTDFSGHLEIIPDEINKPDEKFNFDVIFEKDKDGKVFLAAYHQEKDTEKSKDLAKTSPEKSDPTKIDIGELLKGLGVDPAPSMSLSLQDAFFVNDTNPKFDLLVADVAAGMNLSNLPLVGKILPKDATVSVALRVLYASAAYSNEKTGVDKINDLLPEGVSKITKPTDENNTKGFDLIAEINIGEQTFHLELPVGVDRSHNSTDPNTEPITSKPVTVPPPTEPSGATEKTVPPPVKVNKDGITWLKIGKKFGPVIFNRIGLAYTESKLFVYPDAALSMAGLTFTLNGLSVSSPLSTTTFKPTFDLQGLGLDFAEGPIEIGASFLRRPLMDNSTPPVAVLDKLGNPVYEYDGMATIKTDPFSISALGSYAYVDDHASLFIYAYLDQALGGPGFFYVEGLAAAFGYNRSLLMPTIDQVSMFPLVRQVMAGEAPDDSDPAALLTQQLDAISHYIPPSIGEMFIAIGVKFNSFKLLDSFALLAVSFGNRVEIDVLGQTNIVVPSERPPDVPPLAEIKIQLMAKFIPEEGFLGVQAQLTKDSYVLSKDCHLTGGAAFYSWFKDQPGTDEAKAGDFVVTMGGYHPDFVPPSFYPQVPRLGVNWQVVPELSIKGDMYFALCAHAFMAGGHLEALYESGPLKAWFKAGADFLISWQPYHYDAEIYIDLGASYTYYLFGTHQITLDLGADVHIWGPEFAGTADIHILIFDILVAFGPSGTATPDPISWEDFKQKCLPDKKELSGVIAHGQHGLDGNKIPIVNPKELTINISSPVPVETFSIPATAPPAGKTFAIAPMEVTSGISSTQKFTITQDEVQLNNTDHFIFTPVEQKLPAAIWGNSFKADLNAKDKTIPLVTGMTITTVNILTGNKIEFDKHPQEQAPFNCASGDLKAISYEFLSPSVPVELLEELGIEKGSLIQN